MAKTKAELEADHRQYQVEICEMKRAIDDADYLLSIRYAKQAWKYIDGMIQYQTRYLNGGEFSKFECIYHVLQYAPVVFDKESLEELSELLKAARRVDRSTPADLADELARAKQLLLDAHALSRYIEANQPCAMEDCKARFSGDSSDLQRILGMWHRLGLVELSLVENRQYLSSRAFGAIEVRAKCSSCGVVAHGHLRQFLPEEKCPLCQADAATVFLSPQ